MDGGGLLARLLLVILWYEDVGEALSFDGIAQKIANLRIDNIRVIAVYQTPV